MVPRNIPRLDENAIPCRHNGHYTRDGLLKIAIVNKSNKHTDILKLGRSEVKQHILKPCRSSLPGGGVLAKGTSRRGGRATSTGTGGTGPKNAIFRARPLARRASRDCNERFRAITLSRTFKDGTLASATARRRKQTDAGES